MVRLGRKGGLRGMSALPAMSDIGAAPWHVSDVPKQSSTDCSTPPRSSERLFDYFVDLRQQCWGGRQAEGLYGLHIKYGLQFRGLFHR